MARYCGQCGAVLGASSLQSGRCATCGAAIDPATAPFDTRASTLAAPPVTSDGAVGGERKYGGDPSTDPSGQYVWLPRQPERQESSRVFWTLALLSSAALLVVAIAFFFLLQHGTLAGILSPSSPSSPSVSSGLPASGATATPRPRQTASSAATATSGGGGQPTPTGASSSPTTSPTSAPSPPRLSVSPATINILLCTSSTSRTITIANVGGTNLNWRAIPPYYGYSIIPVLGTIDPGLHQTINVQKIAKNGVVTIASGNAINSPQEITIKCLT